MAKRLLATEEEITVADIPFRRMSAFNTYLSQEGFVRENGAPETYKDGNVVGLVVVRGGYEGASDVFYRVLTSDISSPFAQTVRYFLRETRATIQRQ